jgi:hypothetical protein
MWPKTFEQRLESWTQLRNRASAMALEPALAEINAWWFHAPWKPYYLHWDDRPSWPDPWQLLDDNIYCGLARGLGIMYTIAMLDRADMHDAFLTETDSDNLVLVGKKKYILNWDEDTVLNTNLETKCKRKLTLVELKKQYNLL